MNISANEEGVKNEDIIHIWIKILSKGISEFSEEFFEI